MSSPTADQLAVWRVFLECAFALIDILDAELRVERGMTLRWYDVLVHLEEAEERLRMNELASRILASKSGLTRVVHRMEEAGLVRRERPPDDRRVVQVFITREGLDALHASRAVHRWGIQEHFVRYLAAGDLAAVAHALERCAIMSARSVPDASAAKAPRAGRDPQAVCRRVPRPGRNDQA